MPSSGPIQRSLELSPWGLSLRITSIARAMAAIASRERVRAEGSKYARETRNGVTFIAVIVGLAALISVICGIIVAVQVSHLAKSERQTVNLLYNNPSSCGSQGGTNANC